MAQCMLGNSSQLLVWSKSGPSIVEHGYKACRRRSSSRRGFVQRRGYSVVAALDAWSVGGSSGARSEDPQELLAQTRRRKQLERMQRENESTRGRGGGESTSGRDELSWPIWRKRNSPQSAREITKRIVELTKRRRLDQIMNELEAAEAEGVELTLITMNAALAACVRCEDIDRCLMLWDKMVAPGGVGVDSVSYGTLLKGLGQSGRLDDAFEVLEQMEAGTAPGRPVVTDVHLHTLMDACAQAGEALRARGVLMGLEAGASTFSYNLLIKGYARSDNPLEALKVVDEMKAAGLPLQRLTYNSLILACIRGGDITRAFEYLEEMKALARQLRTSRLLPDVVTYTTLLQGLAEEGDIRAIRSLAAEMQHTPTCVVDRVAYSAIIDACIQTQYPEEGLRVLAEMESRAKENKDLRPRTHVYLALMRALTDRGDSVRVASLQTRMLATAARVWPEDRAEAEELLFEAHVAAGQFEAARAMLSSMGSLQPGGSLSERARGALVRLEVSCGFADDRFCPQMLLAEVSPRAEVGDVMTSAADASIAKGTDSVRDAADALRSRRAVVVVDEQGLCLGAVHAADCMEWDTLLQELVRPLPPPLTRDTPVSGAAAALLQHEAEVVPVAAMGGGTPPVLLTEASDEGPGLIGFIWKQDVIDRDARIKLGAKGQATGRAVRSGKGSGASRASS